MGLFNWESMPDEEISDLYRRKIASCQQLTIARIEVQQGAITLAHAHESEEVILVLEGRWRFYLPWGEVTLGPQQMLAIPPGVEHSSEALEDTVAFDICTPARPDWLSGVDRPLHHDPDQFLWA